MNSLIFYFEFVCECEVSTSTLIDMNIDRFNYAIQFDTKFSQEKVRVVHRSL